MSTTQTYSAVEGVPVEEVRKVVRHWAEQGPLNAMFATIIPYEVIEPMAKPADAKGLRRYFVRLFFDSKEYAITDRVWARNKAEAYKVTRERWQDYDDNARYAFRITEQE